MSGNNRANWQADRRRLVRTARKFVRGEQGAAAVEFALVVFPFLALLFAIVETAIVFFAGQALETAAADSARLIMTGQTQSTPVAQNQTQADVFKSQVCEKLKAMGSLFDCAKVYVDVRTFSGFSGVSFPNPIDQSGNINSTYMTSGPGDIVAVRLMYPWQTYLSFYGFNLANLPGHKLLLVATVAFRNEPYQ